MSNKGGKSHKHCLVGLKRPKSPLHKRDNKAKARVRKAEAVMAFQALTKGC
ncbi:MAG: hypothetical protein Q8O95_01235 [bacterium]|nr:hypothetical protein [bacterium]